MPRFPQLSFAAGELSPEIWGRVDIAKYQSGLETCKNFLIRRQGGIMNRSGLGFVAPAKHFDKTTILIPFQFNTEQTYQLEFGHHYMRVIKDGGTVLNASQAISGITKTNPAVVNKTGHGYTDGEWVYILAEGMSQVNGRFFQVDGATANAFNIVDVLTGITVDSTDFDTFVSGTVASVFELETLYDHTHIERLGYTQSNDVMTLTHKSYEPRDLTRTDHNAWTLTAINFTPSIAAPANVTATATNGSGSDTYEYVITSQVDETGEESLASGSDDCTNNLSTAGNYNTVTWDAVTGADRYNVYKVKNSVYGYIGTTTNTSFEDDNIDPDLTDTPPELRNPFDDTGDYPAAVEYDDQRKVFGGTSNNPQTAWATQTGRFQNMNVSIPTKDDDAWTFRIASRQANEIRHIVSLGDLLVFTSGAEWKFSGGAGDGTTITPNSINVQKQSENGCSFVRPLVVGSEVLYVHDMGRTVSNFGYSFEKDGYDGEELTILSSHLFEQYTIKNWTFHKEPYRCAWAVRTDGTLLSFTYVKTHQVWGWARHETDGKFRWASTIQEGDEHFTYFVVDRTINGNSVKYIERMSSRIFQNVEDAFFVDSGLSLNNWNADEDSTVTLTGGTNWTDEETLTLTENGTSSPFSAGDVGREIFLRVMDENGIITDRVRVEVTAYTSSEVVSVQPLQIIPEALRGVSTAGYAFTQTEVSGLYHLEGKEVAILGDGDVDSATVEDGKITMTVPCAQAHIGLGYNCDMKTLRIVGGPQNSGLVGLSKNIGKIDMVVEDTRGVLAGPDYDNLIEYQQRNTEHYGEPTRMETGIIELIPNMNWNEGQFVLRQADPLPISILSIIPEVEVGG